MAGPIPCPSCGQAVPRGRLACPACGALIGQVRTEPPEPMTALTASDPLPGFEATEPAADERTVAGLPAVFPSSNDLPARDQRPPTPGRASILADLPFDAPDELEGWLVALGSGTGLLGFLLPWRSSTQGGLGGYFDSWGLGIGAHLPIVVLVVIVAALAILPNRIASWARTGVCGMVSGGILLGLVWLYLGGGAELGAMLTAVGGVLLIAGGVLAVAPRRKTGSPGGG